MYVPPCTRVGDTYTDLAATRTCENAGKMPRSLDLLHCSFCGKSQEDVSKLIAGPGVYICNECIGLCVEILFEEGKPLHIAGFKIVPEGKTDGS